MSSSPEDPDLGSSLNIKDYIAAATDAASGTRVVTIVLVVASVLVFIGFWNSFHWSWTNSRLRNAYDPNDWTMYGTLDLNERPEVWPSLFSANDFIAPLSIACKLNDRQDKLSEYLYSKLKPSTQKLLAECVKAECVKTDKRIELFDESTKPFRSALADDFNTLLQAPLLYDEQLFKGITLRKGTNDLLVQVLNKHRPYYQKVMEEMLMRGEEQLKQAPEKREELIRLNRLLLEDAYPREIKDSYVQSLAEAYRIQFQQAAARAYVENVRFVRAPFFGIAFDVNDLGLIGGMGFIIIMLLLRHSLSREIKSLNRSFAEALRGGREQLHHFYHVLAIKQIFTVPEMVGEKRNPWLALSAKFVCILPALVFSMGLFYDWLSVFRYSLYPWEDVSPQLIFECALWGIIVYLSGRCWERQKTIDGIWDYYWELLEPKKSRIILLDKDLVEKYGGDDLANNALRTLGRICQTMR